MLSNSSNNYRSKNYKKVVMTYIRWIAIARFPHGITVLFLCVKVRIAQYDNSLSFSGFPCYFRVLNHLLHMKIFPWDTDIAKFYVVTKNADFKWGHFTRRTVCFHIHWSAITVIIWIPHINAAVICIKYIYVHVRMYAEV